ncbi:MAG: HEAT repeat domain-containing protein [Planctomycetota bacterium]
MSIILTALLLSATPAPHGGGYVAPPLPPDKTPGIAGGPGQGQRPVAPTPPAPGTGSIPTPGTRGGTPSTPGSGGVELGEDTYSWTFWWESQKERFLDLRRKVRSQGPASGSDDFVLGRGRKSDGGPALGPDEADRQRLRDALLQALRDQDSPADLRSACLIALARVGGDGALLTDFLTFLEDGNQELRESAALALGIVGHPAAMEDLAALARDDEDGRRLVGRERVSLRTRAFACYGLGLVARRLDDAARRRAFVVLEAILADEGERRADLRVAAFEAIRILAPSAGYEGSKLRHDALAFVAPFVTGRADESPVPRAHAVAAWTSLAAEGGLADAATLTWLAAEGLDRRSPAQVRRAVATALGVLCRADDGDRLAALRKAAEANADLATRRFAILALGRAGGEDERTWLLRRLGADRTRDEERPWLGFALALHDRQRRAHDPTADLDRTAVATLEAQLERARAPLVSAGLGLALGLLGSRDSGELVREAFERHRNQDRAGGYLAVALGMLRHVDSKERLREVLRDSRRREELSTRVSIALGLLGDKEVALELVDVLGQRNTTSVYASTALALGKVGDRRTIDGLCALCARKDVPNLSRAFAAVAMGLVGAKDDYDWREPIAVDLPYLALVETLSDGSAGLLDIL